VLAIRRMQAWYGPDQLRVDEFQLLE